MKKKAIENRTDIHLLVTTFYAKIRNEPEIAPFFNKIISDWDEHIEKLTNFWENNLFCVKKYSGNPLQVHNAVDSKFNYTLTPSLFGIWLNLWFETLEALFEGKNVETLKNRSRKMGTAFLVNIYNNRKLA